ncbi:MAG: type II secretion system F family protein [Actinomycetota bacterium]
MAETYSYRVRDRSGSLITGELVADSQQRVLERLREMSFIPLEVKAKNKGLQREFSFRKKVKLKDLAVFSRQFATMVNSGLPLLRTLSILEDQTPSRLLGKVLSEIRLDVEQGTALSSAMAKHPKAFNNLFVSMCRAGETSGTLDSVLLRLADTLEKEVSLRRKIKSAMTYPIVVFVLVLIILTVMLVFVVPTFKDLYQQLGGVLPLPTRLLVAVSDVVRGGFLFVAGGAALAIFLFRRWIKTDTGREAFDRFKLKIPIFGGLFHKTALSRFARTLGVLSRSGVPILQALDIVADTVNNKVVANAVLDIQASVKSGESLSHPLERHKVFPPMVVQMMSVGEETGALDAMLEKVSDFYDDEIAATVESLTSLIEPVLIAVVGGTVGAIVIALYLPTFKIFELIK